MIPAPYASFAEIVGWSVPAVLGWILVRRAAPRSRISWLLVVGACVAIVVDKAVDIQIRLHHLGQALVRWLAPESQLRGDDLIYRLLLLGVPVLVTALATAFLLRRDPDLGFAKRISLVGILLVLTYLAARLVPGSAAYLAPPRDFLLEAFCWALVVGGEIAQLRARPHRSEFTSVPLPRGVPVDARGDRERRDRIEGGGGRGHR